MSTLWRSGLGLLVGLGIGLAVAAPTLAQELPTGAARVVENVQTRIFISQSTLQFKVAAILANLDEQFGGSVGP
jgi:hypothetical protein